MTLKLSKNEDPQYLGDGVYASWDGYNFWLTTPMQQIKHEIALERPVLLAFITYLKDRGVDL